MTLGEGARRMYDTYTLIHHFEGNAFSYGLYYLLNGCITVMNKQFICGVVYRKF